MQSILCAVCFLGIRAHVKIKLTLCGHFSAYIPKYEKLRIAQTLQICVRSPKKEFFFSVRTCVRQSVTFIYYDFLYIILASL